MTPRELVRLSKFLSLHLRHRPGDLGLELQRGGWVDVEMLLAAAAHHGQPFSRGELEEVVAQSEKQRFSFDASGERIRANQGHSVPVDLQLVPATPPGTLYHGTSERALPVILREGLRPIGRRQVHLSADAQTAWRVGMRHGRPAILEIDAGTLHADGTPFFLSENGVWLTDGIPPRYLKRIDRVPG
jgi:putative RNA 2'-phosphotransferase